MDNNFICFVYILEIKAYGVYISQLIQYPRACGSYQEDAESRLVKFKSSFQKFYGHHLVNNYGISV